MGLVENSEWTVRLEETTLDAVEVLVEETGCRVFNDIRGNVESRSIDIECM